MIAALARRVGAEHPAFSMSPREIIDWTLRESGYGDLATLEKERWLDLQPPFEESHFLNGFGFPDGKFRFKADWTDTPVANDGMRGAVARHAESARPLAGQRGRRRRSPVQARDLAGPKFPQFDLHPDADLARARTATGSARSIRPTRPGSGSRKATSCNWATSAAGRACMPALVEGVKPGVLVSEGIWPPSAFLDGWGINVLVGDDSVAPLRRRRVSRRQRMGAPGMSRGDSAHFLCPDRRDIRRPDC